MSTGGRWRRLARTQTRRNPSGISSGRGRSQAVISGRLAACVLAGGATSVRRMAVAVVKLGSSVVAEDSGALRLAVIARVCEEVAALHASGVDVVVVTSGAIARGMHLLGLP